MNKEYKELLLTDLCARLPYGVKIWYKYGAWYPKKFATSIRLADEKIALSHIFNKEGEWFPIEEAEEILIKPYLRPMSSITEEEKKEHFDRTMTIDVVQTSKEVIDWLNKKMFDYRGLIERGLAIAVTEDNNLYKE